jgi:hypothetical protein
LATPERFETHLSITIYHPGGIVYSIPEAFDVNAEAEAVRQTMGEKLAALLQQFPVRKASESASYLIIVSKYDEARRKIAIGDTLDEQVGCSVMTLDGNIRDIISEIGRTITVKKKR